jgi:hypothetical protein
MPETANAAQRMTVRRMRFPYADGMNAWWNPARPEFLGQAAGHRFERGS